MATFEYNDKIKFMLPAGFKFSRDEDDEGNEVVSILTGEYENDEGETSYKFNCRVNYTEYDPSEADEEFRSDNLLELLAERMENSKRMKLPGAPETILLNKGMPLSLFGHILKIYASIVLVQVDDWAVLQLITTGTYNDDDPSVNTERYENLFEVLKAARIKGKKLPVEGVSPSEIERALQLTFEEDGEAIDVSPKVQFSFTAGAHTTTYEYTAEGMKEVGKERLTRVAPDKELYPHYNSVRSAGGLGFLGAAVVVNASGTEYNFIPFKHAAEDDEVDEDMKALYNRVIAKDTESYDLHKKAKEMQKLFQVNASVFDPRHDRECELEEGLMHRAYMMSGLRSFAWTLADYCKQHDCTPEDIDFTIASRIANFVADEDWLNYDGTTYCQGLCSGSDLHVFFVPDGVTQADKKKLLPSKEDRDRVKQMKEKFPAYREILSEVHSLNALRKDLKYIYPPVKVLWDKLEEDRDYDEALLGNEADIVYAWCALALAAKEPFFSEDGPMTCYFSQPVDEETQRAKWEADEAERAEEAAEEWKHKYEKYLDNNPVIDFNGKTFVFSGLAGHYAEKDDPIVLRVIEKGGQYRSKVSGLTNYLVVDPRYAGQSKIVAVMEQLQKGKNIKVILLEDLEKALEGKTATNKASTTKETSTVTEEKKTAEETDAAETDFSDDSEILAYLDRGFVVLTPSISDVETSDDGIITKYKGDANKVVITGYFHGIGKYAFSNNNVIEEVAILSGVKTIGEGAFFSCGNLMSVTMDEGVEIIDDSAFLSCDKLTSVSLPDSLKELKQDVFCGCRSLEQIKLPQSLTSIGEGAFNGCSELKEISIPDSVRYIGSYPFNGCKKLEYLYIPPTVEELGDGWLDDLSDFWAIIHVEKGSPAERGLLKCSDVEKYTIVYEKPNESEIEAHYNNPYGVSGSEFIIRDEVLIGVETADEKIEIPATVKKISKEAFEKCGRVKEIIVPEGVAEIESEAFSETRRLETVSLPTTLKTLCSFTLLEELKEISIPDGITEIPDRAFLLCKNLKKIVFPSSLRIIGQSAFEKTAVEEVVIPDSVVTIGNFAFDECRNLKNVVMSTRVREIGENAFSKTAINSICLPDTLTAIGDSAFLECEYVERVIIPDSVNKLGEFVFSGCINLREATLPSTLKRIPDNLFSGCRQLSSITLGNSIKTIGKWAFSDCESLSSISIPKSVTEIKQGAFSNCSSLRKVFIPDSVVSIGEYAFSGCEGITDIYIPSSVTRFGESSLNFYPAEPRVHIIKGSIAEKACEDDFITNVVYETEASMISVEKADYKSDSDTEAQTYAQKQTTANSPSVNAEESAGLADVMGDLSAQIAEMQNQEASPASSSSYSRAGAPSYSKPATVPPTSYPDTISAPLASDSGSGKDTLGNTNKEHDAAGQKSEVNYVIHYDLNGGNGRFPNQKKKAEETIIIHKDIPTHKDGMIFECWISYDKRIKGNRFYPGDSYCYDFSTTLKAFWKREGDNLFYYDNAYHNIPEPATHKEPPQQKKKEGCYLATAVYGSYDAPQVMALRRYRDETLRNTAFGRWFIRTYYRLSPPIAEKLKNAKQINHFVRSILDKWVERLNNKQL